MRPDREDRRRRNSRRHPSQRPGPPWPAHHRPPHWHRGRRRHQRMLLLRFILLFGLIVLFIVAGMALLAWLITGWIGATEQVAVAVWLAGCGLALALPLLAVTLAIRAARSITTPLVDVMAAADSVAEGDLGARVAVQGTGEMRQLARSFNRMAEELEQADRQRRNLTADVAHELRTPLHIIRGNLEGVLDGVYEPTDSHIAATLEETRLLGRLVEDLHTLSLAEAGHLPMHWEPVDVTELLADVATSFQGQAQAASVALLVEAGADGIDWNITGDAGRLDQVVSNLVANALRHTPPGGQITLQAIPTVSGVRITVSDNGQGIAEEELAHVFDRFWSRARTGSDRPAGLQVADGDPEAMTPALASGGGLGLAIARSLVEAHDGTIAVSSAPGKGTTFAIELPRAVNS